MPFRFSLQKVLDYREQLEEEAKNRFALVQRQYREAKAQLAALSSELETQEARLYGQVIDNAGERWLLESFIKGLRADIEATTARVQNLRATRDEMRRILAARSMDKKLLEKLKERKYRQFLLDERLKEQRFNDEIATLRYKAPNF
ncbi:flagellar export protein FliJ [uncultured Desulfovibrio sp.]|uniref:flagellar export protein FliJ n=1 Tax=uncultured Desulfovibrio sp. TaxID=167968 RepID=UPI001C39A9B3|nr:flagellar export protein FliJ [uncultured Desulfovibrio sp.]HIX40902.1 flagellar export protein FliJ [Candidatus Desulfovibrio intestinigallinarum]